MNVGAIVAATVLVAAVGLFIGIFLGVAGKKFAVEVDEEGNEITADEEYQQKMTDLMIKKAEEASTAAQK